MEISMNSRPSILQFSSVAQSRLTLQHHGLQHARPPCPSPTPRAYSNSCPLSQQCHPTISSSDIPVSSCLESFPASGPFQMTQFFASSSQSIGVSASTSVLPVNIQDWFPLGWTGCISLLSKGLSRVFSNITVQKHQFLSAQLSFGEGNGTPLQYSCLENPMDGGAWKAAVHGVAEGRTRLSNFTFTHWRRKWQPTPEFLPGEFQGQGSLVAALWGHTESDTTEVT